MDRPSYNCIIGIDAGKNGGIAIWTNESQKAVTYKMPADMSDLRMLFRHYAEKYSTIVFIEKVQLRPDDLAIRGKAYRIQSMLRDYQKLVDMAEAQELPVIEVHPMTWQSYLNLRIKIKEEKVNRKNRYKAAASSFYSECKVTLWNSDALLIMHFGRKKLQFDLVWMLKNTPQKKESKFILK